MGQPRQALLRSLAYDRPRAEACCELDRWFFRREQIPLAAYWYSLTPTCTLDDSRGGLASPDCYSYLACIQLCVCYSRLNDLKQGQKMNDLAARFKPDTAPVLHNRAWLQHTVTKGSHGAAPLDPV